MRSVISVLSSWLLTERGGACSRLPKFSFCKILLDVLVLCIIPMPWKPGTAADSLASACRGQDSSSPVGGTDEEANGP